MEYVQGEMGSITVMRIMFFSLFYSFACCFSTTMFMVK